MLFSENVVILCLSNTDLSSQKLDIRLKCSSNIPHTSHHMYNCEYFFRCIFTSTSIIPYSAKFSRRIIFAFFADWSGTAKIRRREMRLTVKGVANKFPSSAKIVSTKHFKLRDPRKLCASKICRYMVATSLVSRSPCSRKCKTTN